MSEDNQPRKLVESWSEQHGYDFDGEQIEEDGEVVGWFDEETGMTTVEVRGNDGWQKVTGIPEAIHEGNDELVIYSVPFTYGIMPDRELIGF